MANLGVKITVEITVEITVDQQFYDVVDNWRVKKLEFVSLSADNNSMYGLYMRGLILSDNKQIEQAAMMGIDASLHHMGLLCFKTQDKKQNYHLALDYFHQAAAQEYVLAFVQIYLFNNRGRGIPKNYKECEKWRKRTLAGGVKSLY